MFYIDHCLIDVPLFWGYRGLPLFEFRILASITVLPGYLFHLSFVLIGNCIHLAKKDEQIIE